jgi:hypothetical protein
VILADEAGMTGTRPLSELASRARRRRKGSAVEGTPPRSDAARRR